MRVCRICIICKYTVLFFICVTLLVIVLPHTHASEGNAETFLNITSAIHRNSYVSQASRLKKPAPVGYIAFIVSSRAEAIDFYAVLYRIIEWKKYRVALIMTCEITLDMQKLLQTLPLHLLCDLFIYFYEKFGIFRSPLSIHAWAMQEFSLLLSDLPITALVLPAGPEVKVCRSGCVR